MATVPVMWCFGDEPVRSNLKDVANVFLGTSDQHWIDEETWPAGMTLRHWLVQRGGDEYGQLLDGPTAGAWCPYVLLLHDYRSRPWYSRNSLRDVIDDDATETLAADHPAEKRLAWTLADLQAACPPPKLVEPSNCQQPPASRTRLYMHGSSNRLPCVVLMISVPKTLKKCIVDQAALPRPVLAFGAIRSLTNNKISLTQRSLAKCHSVTMSNVIDSWVAVPTLVNSLFPELDQPFHIKPIYIHVYWNNPDKWIDHLICEMMSRFPCLRYDGDQFDACGYLFMRAPTYYPVKPTDIHLGELLKSINRFIDPTDIFDIAYVYSSPTCKRPPVALSTHPEARDYRGEPVGVVLHIFPAVFCLDLGVDPENVLNHSLVLALAHIHMMSLRINHGLRDVFCIVSSYEYIRVLWLPDCDDVAYGIDEGLAQNDFPLTRYPYTSIIPLPPHPVLSAPQEMCMDSLSDPPQHGHEQPSQGPQAVPDEDEVHGTPVIQLNDPRYKLAIAVALFKMTHARQHQSALWNLPNDQPFRPILEPGAKAIFVQTDNRSPLLRAMDLPFSPDKLCVRPLPREDQDSLPEGYFVLHYLGGNTDGRAWLAATPKGVACVLKFTGPYHTDERIRWQRIWGLQAYDVSIANHAVLVMPYIYLVEVERFHDNSFCQCVVSTICTLAANHITHYSVKPKHVGEYLYRGEHRVLFIDVARANWGNRCTRTINEGVHFMLGETLLSSISTTSALNRHPAHRKTIEIIAARAKQCPDQFVKDIRSIRCDDRDATDTDPE